MPHLYILKHLGFFIKNKIAYKWLSDKLSPGQTWRLIYPLVRLYRPTLATNPSNSKVRAA